MIACHSRRSDNRWACFTIKLALLLCSNQRCLLNSKLSDYPSPPIVGTDEETALRNAIQNRMPGVNLLTCHRHLRENAQRHVSKSTTERIQKSIISKMFGADGLTSEIDEVVLEAKSEQILNTIREEAPDFSTYFTKNIFPKIESNRDIVENNPWLSTTWTNNNSESFNHVIKTRVNWKSGPVVELINTLHDLVKSQYKDTERAFISTGTFSLVPDFETFKIPVNSWINKTKEQRDRHLLKFLKTYKPQQHRSVISSDAALTILRSTANGTRPGQKKRKRTAKTTTVK